MNDPKRSVDAVPADEIINKIQELRTGDSVLQEEMSKLTIERNYYKSQLNRSSSVSPQRSGQRRATGGGGGGLFDGGWKKVVASFGSVASPLQKDSLVTDVHSLPSENTAPAAVVNLMDNDYSGDGGGSSPAVVNLMDNDYSGDGSSAPAAAAVNFMDNQYLNILESMGQSVHIFDVNYRIIYWNKTAEYIYGYSPSEALGQDVLKLLTDDRHFELASDIIHRVSVGESWTGQFPVRNKRGERFMSVATDTPFYDDDKILIGIICVSSDAKAFREPNVAFSQVKHSDTDGGFSRSGPRLISSSRLGGLGGLGGLDLQQPLQVAASKISNLASRVTNKVKSKMKNGGENIVDEGGSGDSHHSDVLSDNNREEAGSSGGSTPRGDVQQSPFGKFLHANNEEAKNSRDSGDDVGDGKPGISKRLTSKAAEAWIGRKNLSWPWKGNEQERTDAKPKQFGWPWIHQNDQENDLNQPTTSVFPSKTDNQETNKALNTEASSSSSSSSGSTSSTGGTANKVDVDSDQECEIAWDDLTIGDQIGEGSCGTVFHATWNGSDVAVKLFSKQEYSDDVILSFKQEVSLMKRLRHPNILLFMGAVTSVQHLCIVIELLPRGSLYRLIRKNSGKLDWKRKTQMALDIARGVNYLHHCNPPIIHRDLKSSNLLVDKNWSVKVGDFGLSRIKHETYLITKTGKGTPQWMAPEVIRNEPSDEKSDVYSFGVILWELATEKVPWDGLNSMQVIGAVGFMDQRLEIPEDVDPLWASLIQSCWHRDPKSRPNFQELLEKLRDVNRHFTQQLQNSRASTNSTSQKDT